ncbi:PAQR family membrane homeostasis protein [Fervidobacterium islandicum]|uniref:PAQR family membrane homeostasis protein TrhA n=1 Tax=Fervidobacterium islandicum TaxID=2423 RepID=UPI003A78A671
MKDKDNIEKYTLGEEIANSVTHGVGALLSIAGAVVLIVIASLQGDVLKILSAVVYGFSLFLLYMNSTLYHAIQHKTAKYVLEILDHSSIYVLIAGSYTPFLLLAIKSVTGTLFLCMIWVLAILGIIFKVFFVRKFVYLSTLFYVIMGWIVVLIFKPLNKSVDSGIIWLLVSGGLMYTLGAVFYVWRKFKFHHMVWHIFVVFGSLFHYFAILGLILAKA